MNNIKSVICIADMGCIRIYNKSLSCFFNNGFGDGAFAVTIGSNNDTIYRNNDKWKYEGQFEISKNRKAYLAYYDCKSKDPVATFKKGRYAVYSNCGNIYIGKWE
jgi:hypothetical protein